MPITREQVTQIIEGIYERRNVKDQCHAMGVQEKAFYVALEEYPDLLQFYGRAQQAKAESYAEEIIDIADTETDAQKARNRIDTRRWYAQKMKPDKFGDRIDLNVNQIVDIGSALTEALSRTKVPIRDLHSSSSLQRPDIRPETRRIASDCKSEDAEMTSELEDILK